MQLRELPVSTTAVSTTAAQRRARRHRAYAAYFRTARMGEIALSSVALHGKVPDLSPGVDLGGVLFAFCDAEQWLLALGIASSLTPDGVLRYLAPPFPRARCTALQFGSLRLRPEGEGLTELRT